MSTEQSSSSLFQQGVSLIGNSDSLVSDGRYAQCTAQDMFAHTHIFLVCAAQDLGTVSVRLFHACLQKHSSSPMRHDSQSPLFPVHPAPDASSLSSPLVPSHGGTLRDPRPEGLFGRFAEQPLATKPGAGQGVTVVGGPMGLHSRVRTDVFSPCTEAGQGRSMLPRRRCDALTLFLCRDAETALVGKGKVIADGCLFQSFISWSCQLAGCDSGLREPSSKTTARTTEEQQHQ